MRPVDQETLESCIFCQIVGGKVPAKQVYTDERCIAILDINPAAPGHVLLLPKKHVPILPMLGNDELVHLAKIAQELIRSQKKALLKSSVTLFVASGQVAGQQSGHFLLQLIPREAGDNLGLLHPESHPLDSKTILDLKQKITKVLSPAK